MKYLKKIITVSIMGILFLTGCGGGGAGDTVLGSAITDNPVTQTAESMKDTVISGDIVSKPVINGQIIVTDPMGHKLGGGVTDKNGHYSINIGHYDGPVQVELVCGENSKIVINGMEAECPAGEMVKVAENVTGGNKENIINITPLGEMVNSMTGVFGGMTSKNIHKSKRAVSQLFGGIDPIKSNPYSYNYQSILKAIQKAAKDQGISEKEFLAKIEEDMQKGYISPRSKTARGLRENLLYYILFTALIKAIDDDEVYNIDVDEDTKDDIELAKNMIRDLKKDAVLIIDYKDKNHEGILKKELKNFQQRVKEYLAPVTDYTIFSQIQIAKLIKKAVDENSSSKSEDFFIKDSKEAMNLTVDKSDDNEWRYTIDNSKEIFEGIVKIKEDKEYKISGELPSAKESYVNDDVKNLEKIDTVVTVLKKEDNKLRLQISGEAKTLYEEEPSFDITINSSDITVFINENDIKSAQPQTVNLSARIKEYEIDGILDLLKYKQNSTYAKNDHFLPTQSKFKGTVKNTQSKTEFNGDIELDLKDFDNIDFSKVNKTNPAPYILKLAGDLKVLNDTRAISAYIEYLNADRVKVETQSSIGNRAINAEGEVGIDYTNEKITSFDLHFTNQDSIKFDTKMDENKNITGTISKDNQKLGDVKKINGIPSIKYKDGSLQPLI